MREIESITAKSVEEALQVLDRHGEKATLLAGGSEIAVYIRDGLLRPERILNVNRLEKLRYIREEGGRIRIGALTLQSTIKNSNLLRAKVPILYDYAWVFGAVAIQNIATLGGNLVNASPVADSTPPLMVLKTVVTLRSAKGERNVPLEKFFLGPGKTVRKPEELLTEVSFPLPAKNERGFYLRLGQRKLLSISKVGVAFQAKVEGETFSDVRVALGAVAPKVILAPKTMACLEGKAYTPEAVEEASRIIRTESSGITDVRSTAAYRDRMAGALLVKGLASMMGV